MANGADNLFIQQHTIPTHQQRVTKDFYDTAGGIVIYHGFHPLLAMVYRCFNINLLGYKVYLEYLEVQGRFGGKW